MKARISVPWKLALSAHNNGGLVIAQVKRIAKAGTLRPHDVRVPGILVDTIVEAPDQLQTTATTYDPAISGELFRPLETFRTGEFNVAKVIARRVLQELRSGWAVNIGFGISANVPRILMEEGRHGDITWVIEQGRGWRCSVARLQIRLFVECRGICVFAPSIHLFSGGGFRRIASVVSADRQERLGQCLQADGPPARDRRRRRICRHHLKRAERIVFSGYFNAGAKLAVADGRLVIEKEGRIAKIVDEVEQVSFSGKRAVEQGQDVTYVTERCVMKLTGSGLVVTEIAPGADMDKDVLQQAGTPLQVSPDLKVMDEALFHPEPFGLSLRPG